MHDDGTITWRQLWAGATTQLGDRGEARWICEEASGTSGAEWLGVLDQPAGAHAVADLDSMISRREMGEPIQYVLGHWPFRRLDLFVDRRVLIPRPETEAVAGVAIEAARSFAPQDEDGQGDEDDVIVVVDLGTGSGAIGLAVAEELPLEGTAVWLTDASSEALDVARGEPCRDRPLGGKRQDRRGIVVRRARRTARGAAPRRSRRGEQPALRRARRSPP